VSTLFVKNRIPDGSKLCISIVEGPHTPPGSFVGSARYLLDNGSEEIWDDSDVHPGPKCKKLTSPKGYTWRVRVLFTSKEVRTAIVRATVFGPDGEVFGATYNKPFTGRNGDVARATIIAITLQ